MQRIANAADIDGPGIAQHAAADGGALQVEERAGVNLNRSGGRGVGDGDVLKIQRAASGCL